MADNSIAIIRPHHALALLHAISKEEYRFYLRGIFIQPHPEQGAVMTATDGHILVTIHDPDALVLGAPQIWKIQEVQKQLTAAVKEFKQFEPWLRYEQCASAEFRAAFALGADSKEASEVNWDTANCRPLAMDVRIDGSFPDYARVFPYEIGEARSGTTLSLKVLSKIQKFASAFSDSTNPPITIEPLEEGGPIPWRVKSRDAEAIGLAMPMRGNRLHSYPKWLLQQFGREQDANNVVPLKRGA